MPARCIRGPHQPTAHTHWHKCKSQRETISRIYAQSVRARDTLHKTKCQYQARAGGCHTGVPARCNRGPHQPTAHTHSLKWTSQRATGSTIYAQSVRARDTLHKTKCQYQTRAGGCHSGVPARRNRVPHQPAAHTHSLKWKSQRETSSTIYAQGVRVRDTLHKTKCQYQTRARGCHSGVPARCTLWPHQPAARTHSHPSRKGEYTTSVQLRCKRIGLRVCS